MYMYIYICMYVCMHACMYVCIYICQYICKREREREGARELYSCFQLDPIPSRMSSIPGIHWRFAGKFPRSRLIQIYAHLKQYIPRAKWLPVTRECWRPLAATCGHSSGCKWLPVTRECWRPLAAT